MTFINYASREINCKIVYYGPGLCGKTTNLQYIFDSTALDVTQFRQKIGAKALRDFFQQYAFDDPIHFIGHSAPAPVFLQFGKEDEGIPEKMARGYFERFAEPPF